MIEIGETEGLSLMGLREVVFESVYRGSGVMNAFARLFFMSTVGQIPVSGNDVLHHMLTQSRAANESLVLAASLMDDHYSPHSRVVCDSCHLRLEDSVRWKCLQCDDYDLCVSCEATHWDNPGDHNAEHLFVKLLTSPLPASNPIAIMKRDLLIAHEEETKAKGKRTAEEAAAVALALTEQLESTLEEAVALAKAIQAEARQRIGIDS